MQGTNGIVGKPVFAAICHTAFPNEADRSDRSSELVLRRQLHAWINSGTQGTGYGRCARHVPVECEPDCAATCLIPDQAESSSPCEERLGSAHAISSIAQGEIADCSQKRRLLNGHYFSLPAIRATRRYWMVFHDVVTVQCAPRLESRDRAHRPPSVSNLRTRCGPGERGPRKSSAQLSFPIHAPALPSCLCSS
jgi:hypothetical protein